MDVPGAAGNPRPVHARVAVAVWFVVAVLAWLFVALLLGLLIGKVIGLSDDE